MSVTPDHSTTNRSPPPRRPLPVLLYGALALGLVTVLFQVTESTTTTTSHPVAPPTTDLVRTVPLATLVPGLTGTLHAVERSQQLNLISWDAEGPLSIGSSLPPGRPNQIALDASGELLGVSILETSSRTGTILVGGPSGLTDLGINATSFAWDQAEPGLMLAISVPTESGEALLVRVSVEAGMAIAVQPIVAVGRHDAVLASGPWGHLLAKHENGTNQIVLVDAAGERVWSRHAHWAYASSTGDLLLSFYNNEIREFNRIELDSNPTDPGAWFELPSLGVTGVGWSPDGEEVAVVSYTGSAAKSQLDIYDNEGNPLHRLPLEWHVWDVKWSQDGRFLIMPGVQARSYAILFYDRDNERLTPVMFDHPVQVAVLAQ